VLEDLIGLDRHRPVQPPGGSQVPVRLLWLHEWCGVEVLRCREAPGNQQDTQSTEPSWPHLLAEILAGWGNRHAGTQSLPASQYPTRHTPMAGRAGEKVPGMTCRSLMAWKGANGRLMPPRWCKVVPLADPPCPSQTTRLWHRPLGEFLGGPGRYATTSSERPAASSCLRSRTTISRAGAERTHSPHGHVRRPESPRRPADNGIVQAGVLRNRTGITQEGISEAIPPEACSRMAGIAHASRAAHRGRDSGVNAG
jgi:hypothetical protein